MPADELQAAGEARAWGRQAGSVESSNPSPALDPEWPLPWDTLKIEVKLGISHKPNCDIKNIASPSISDLSS